MKNFIKSLANKLEVSELLLYNDYINLIENPEVIKTIYDEKSEEYVKCILFLVRIPFKDNKLFFDGLRDKYLNALLVLANIDEYLVVTILENTLYWRDLFSLWVKINKLSICKEEKIEKYDKLIRNIRTILNNQRATDLINYKNNENISLLAKYCPSEKSYFDKEAYWYNEGKKESNISFMIRQNMSKISGYKKHDFPDNMLIPFSAKKQWRQENAMLKEKLNIIERKLCKKESIEPSDYVPKKCAKKNSIDVCIDLKLDICKYIEDLIIGKSTYRNQSNH